MPFFNKVIGQEHAITELREEIRRGRTHHAYLFEGARGTGRLTLARAFAAAVLCGADSHEKTENLVAAGSHPDYLELPRQVPILRIARFVSRQSQANDKVEHEPVLEFIWRKPFVSDRSVLVVPDAERMNEPAANAFLKTLEEPPGDALVILTTSARDRLLPTIVSRCRRILVRPLPVNDIREELLQRGIRTSADQAGDLALISEGSLGRAIELSAGDTAEHWQWLQEQFSEITPAGALRFATGLAKRCKEAGKDGHARRGMATALLDLSALLIRNRLREGMNPRSAWHALHALWKAGEQLVANVSYELVMHEAAFECFAALKQG